MRWGLLAVLALAVGVAGCPTVDDDDTGDDDDATADDDDSGVADDDDSGATDDDDVTADDDDATVDDDDATEAGPYTAAGIVLDDSGAPLEGVDVSALATTDGDGRFSFETEGAAVLGFVSEGFAPTWQGSVASPAGTHATLAVMTSPDATLSLPVLAGGSVGAVTIGAGTVDVAGLVTVTVTEYDADETAALPEFPTPTTVFGALRVDLSNDAGPVSLTEGSTMEFALPLTNGDGSLTPGLDLQGWRYDEDAGAWAFQGLGETVELPDGSFVGSFLADRPGLWTAATELSALGCIEGRVTNVAGSPRPGAWIRAAGEGSATLGHADADGEFEITVSAGLEHTFEVLWVDGDDAGYAEGVATSGADGGSCTDLGDIVAPVETCISGVALDLGGSPIEGLDITTSLGTTTTSGIAGSYCAAVPVLRSVTMFGPTASTSGGYLPWTVVTAPGDPACIGGCPNIAPVRAYPITSCASGTTTVNGTPAAASVEVFDNAGDALPVYAFESEADGTFCTEVPAGTSVYATSPDAALSCTEAEVSTVGAPSATCPNFLCVELGTVACVE